MLAFAMKHLHHVPVGSKDTSTSLLTKLVPDKMGLSQQLHSKAACLIIRPAVRSGISCNEQLFVHAHLCLVCLRSQGVMDIVLKTLLS